MRFQEVALDNMLAPPMHIRFDMFLIQPQSGAHREQHTSLNFRSMSPTTSLAME